MPPSKSTTAPSISSASGTLKRSRSSNQQSLKQGLLGFSSAKRTGSTGSLTKGKPSGSLKPSRSSSAVPTSAAVIDLSNDSDSDDEGVVFELEDDEGRVLVEEEVEPPVKRRRAEVAKGAKPKAIFDARDGEENGVAQSPPEKRGSKRGAKLKGKTEAEEPAAAEKAGDVEEKPKLNVKDRKWRKHFGEVREKMGHLEPIHSEDKNMVDHILRVFDLSYEYGPCIGVTRLERWERAHAFGLNPPAEVKDILLTKGGGGDDRYAQCVFYGEV